MKNAQSKDLILLKIILLGGVSGKTCIFERYCDNCFSENILATTGINFKSKTIQFNNYNIKLIIWDPSGQERFRNITRQYILGVDGIIFVCDITDYHSLNLMISFIEWENDIEQNSKKIICANRCDLEEKREIPKEEIEKYGISQNMEVFETSAKTGKNINEAFQRLVELIIRKKEKDKEIIEQMNNEKLLFNFRIDLISSQIYNSQKRIFNLFCDNAGYSLGRKILEFYKHKISLMIYINNIKNIIEKDYFLGKIKSEKDGIIYIFDLYGNSTFEDIKSALEQRNEYNSERIIVLKINDSDNKTKELSKIIENYAISLEIKVFIIDKINYEIVSEIFYKLISLILKNKANPRIYESFNQHIIDNIYKFRFAILGDKYSGKSEIFKEYSNFKEQRLKILDINKYKIKLEIYDIDETNILELLNKYKINGIIFIFSPDSLESFEKIKEFINEIKKNYTNEYKNIICVNKNNINSEIIPKEMNTYLIEQKMDIIEINSKIKDIVDKILVRLTYQILLKKKNNQIIIEFYNFYREYLPIHNYEKKLNKYLDF